MSEAEKWASLRKRMVSDQLVCRGIVDQGVLHALQKVPREQFVPEAIQHRAYDDAALPIACNQTISQPLMVALMSEALSLKGHERILEVGTGSGYQTAILAEIIGTQGLHRSPPAGRGRIPRSARASPLRCDARRSSRTPMPACPLGPIASRWPDCDSSGPDRTTTTGCSREREIGHTDFDHTCFLPVRSALG